MIGIGHALSGHQAYQKSMATFSDTAISATLPALFKDRT
jgi:hypothetical protein